MRVERWAMIVLVAIASACGGPDGSEAGGGRSAPAPTTAAAPTETETTDPTATTVTTAPSVSPSGPNLWFDGIWPDNRDALDSMRDAFDQGHQPWRADPVATARAYLLDLGLSEPAMGELVTGGGGYRRVSFVAGVVSGSVTLRQVASDPLPYVVRVDSARATVVSTEREGDSLRVEVVSLAPGTIVARAGDFASEWQDEQRASADVGPPVTLTLVVDGSSRPLLLEVRHEGSDGAVGITRIRIQPSMPSSASNTPAGDRLSATSTLRPDGLGPIDLGMTHDEALAAAGGPMIVIGSEHCDMLRGSEGPEFVHLIAPAGFDGRIAVITVASDAVSTAEGIRLGSTEAEVVAAYPGIERRGSGDAHRLLHRVTGALAAGDAVLSFVVVNSKVVAMEAGIGAMVESDELCA